MNRQTLARGLLLGVLAATIALALVYRERLDPRALDEWVSGAGVLGPLAFIAIYALATVLFLPGSVLTLAGGALFGPVWGTVYSLAGATLGASVAFVLARYVAADWVERKASGRVKQLIDGVRDEGWRFVAFVRLVPLFPFNLLNYALGLTRIGLGAYVAATFVFMLPGAFAYTWLGYAGREAVAGGEGLVRKVLIAVALLGAVAFLPRLARRLRGARAHAPARDDRTAGVKDPASARRPPRRRWFFVVAFVLLAVFLGWRMLRPMNIFSVSEAFERPVDTTAAPPSLGALRAEQCGSCHGEFFEEWRSSMHSRAWTDPYFQVDWQFDGAQQICKNCHIPLDRQQEERVLGFRDAAKWDPVLEPNPGFDPALQHEGVTCAACHLRNGRILGVFGEANEAHPVEKIASGNELCLRCHVVSGERWDTFWRYPPCGTVTEIQAGHGAKLSRSGETRLSDPAALQCVDCHMPLIERALVAGGKLRATRRHLWRGGHDPDMLRKALSVRLEQTPAGSRRFRLTLTNVGAAHFVPTGTPDRHLVLSVRLLDADGRVLAESERVIKRTVLWRPFIVDLWDNRLRPGQPATHDFEFSQRGAAQARSVEAVLRYGLLEESRRRRIGYQNKEPIAYELYRERQPL